MSQRTKGRRERVDLLQPGSPLNALSDGKGKRRTLGDRLTLWIAQGIGAGRSPVAPGTMGTLVGVGWFLLLILPGDALVFTIGVAGGISLSVWLGGRAEALLGRRDPPSVVLDEIVGYPMALLVPLGAEALGSGRWGGLDWCRKPEAWLLVLASFVGFRLFDIWKPWPIRTSQRLPGGWGITIDDVLAAGYVNLAWLVLRWFGT